MESSSASAGKGEEIDFSASCRVNYALMHPVEQHLAVMELIPPKSLNIT